MTVTRLRFLFVAEGLSVGFLLPFLVPVLAASGLSAAAIGLVLAISAALSLISYPTWGLLADGPVGRERSLVITALIAAAAGLAILVVGANPNPLAVAVACLSLGLAPWAPLTDALTLQVLGADASTYGRVRLWGSAGFAASALMGGVLYVWFGPPIVVFAFTIGCVAVAALALVRPTGVPRTRATPPAGTGAPTVANATDATAPLLTQPAMGLRPFLDRAATRRVLRSSPVLLPFLAAVFLQAMGNSAALTFLSLRIIDQGGGAVLIGVAAAIPAMVEVPFFSASRWFTSHLGLRVLFVVGTGVAAAQLAVVALATQPGTVAAVRAVDGGALALRNIAIVLIVGACLPARLRAVGQSLVWLVAGGFAPIAGDVLAGLVYQALGSSALFGLSALIVASSSVLGYAVLSGASWGRPIPNPAPVDPGSTLPHL